MVDYVRADYAAVAGTAQHAARASVATTAGNVATEIAAHVADDAAHVMYARGWEPPGTNTRSPAGPVFDIAIRGMYKERGFVFGTAAAPTGKADIAIASLEQLNAYWQPLGGVLDANNNVLGGGGRATINQEIQRYPYQFSVGNHVLEANALRLQAVLHAGSWARQACGDITSGQATGVTINDVGGSTAMVYGDLGLTLTDFGNIVVGQCFVSPWGGIGYVSAKNTGGGTLTLHRVSCAAQAGAKINWALQFLPCFFATAAANITGGSSTSATLTSVPTGVATGMVTFVVTAAGQQPISRDTAKVTGIVGNVVSFDSPIGDSLTATGGAGLMFIPHVSSGMMWTRTGYNPAIGGRRAVAIDAYVTFPSFDSGAPADIFTRAQLNAWLSANPGALNGYWPAAWMYEFREGNVTVPGARLLGSELDICEIFGRPNRGSRVWTGYLHTGPYTRAVAAVAGASWGAQTADSELLTANAAWLVYNASLCTGAQRRLSVVWTNDRVIHYLDGVPICQSAWANEADYPLQLGFNVACGALGANTPFSILYPFSDAMVTGQHLKVHRVDIYRA